MPGLGIPVELGAEFIHGEAEATYALLHRARIPPLMAIREQRSPRGGRLVRINSFAEAQRAVQGARLDRDVSFEKFISAQKIPARTKTFARMMVGFRSVTKPSLAKVGTRWRTRSNKSFSLPDFGL